MSVLSILEAAVSQQQESKEPKYSKEIFDSIYENDNVNIITRDIAFRLACGLSKKEAINECASWARKSEADIHKNYVECIKLASSASPDSIVNDVPGNYTMGAIRRSFKHINYNHNGKSTLVDSIPCGNFASPGVIAQGNKSFDVRAKNAQKIHAIELLNNLLN